MHPLSVALSVILLFACSLGLPFLHIQAVAVGIVAVCSVFLIAAAARKVATVGLLILLIGFFGTSGISATALVLTMIVGTGVLARLLEKCRSPFLWAIPIVAFALVAIITRDLLSSAYALCYALPALALYLSFSKGASRVGAICLTSTAVFVSVAAFVLAFLYKSTGSLDPAPLYDFSMEIREQLAKMLMELQIQLPEGDVAPFLTELDAQNIASLAVSLFPALLIISCNAVAFFAQKLLFLLVQRAGEIEKLNSRMLALIMSPYAGAIFILSFFISTLAAMSSDYALINTVCQNIFLIFIPGLAVSGVMIKLAKITHTRRGAWIIIPFAFLAFFNVGSAVLLAAGLGAYYSIANPLSEFLRSRADRNQ